MTAEPWLAIVVGILYACGVYLVLRRSVVKLLVGLALLSHAANLLVFTAGGVQRGRAPVIPSDATAASGTADPIPQALVLTAIVISFGVLAFAVTLIHRVHQETGSDDLDRLDG
jgi:multicomponent Na+:H+ antiporter subunit C